MQMFRSAALRPAAVLAATVVLASSFAGSVSAATYRSANGYTISPPAGWTTSKGMMGSEVVFMNPTRENINVVVQAVPRGTTIEKARTDTITLLRRMMTGYKLGSPPQKLRALQAFALRGGKLYVFTCTAHQATYARFAGTFQNVLRSVRWTK